VIPADLLVTGGTVLTVDDAGTVVPDGAVAVRDGEIVAVGAAAELTARFAAAGTPDAAGCLVLPGLVDTHAQLAMNLTAADVRHTVVDGRVLMRDRVLTTIDEKTVLDRMKQLRRERAAAEEWA
jgi:5-methylthioadenosine/S-adenosylhomocysteine deaminase